MSRIYFTSAEREVEVRGTERAHAGVMCTDLLEAVLRIHGTRRYGADSLIRLVPKGSYLWSVKPEARGPMLGVYLGTGGTFVIDGEEHDTFTVALNTLVSMGNDALIFQARLHGQCEIHGWVDGPNREWLAGVIEEGLECGVLRPGTDVHPTGWAAVLELLRETDDGPVVTSYSVCEEFPDQEVVIEAGLWPDGRDRGEWYEMPADEQWTLAVEALRKVSPEWSPDGWDGRFGSGLSGFDVRRIADEMPVPV